MCTMTRKVCCGPLSRNSSETSSGYKKDKCGIWKTVKGWFSMYEIKEAASQGGYLNGIYGYGVLRDLPVWTLKHGHFLIMGGIHLVEPPEEAGSTIAEAITVVDPGAASETINVQPRNTASEKADTEKGRAPAGNKLKDEERNAEGVSDFFITQVLLFLTSDSYSDVDLPGPY